MKERFLVARNVTRVVFLLLKKLQQKYCVHVVEILENKCNTCWNEYVSLAEAAIFEYAFRLGARLIIEVQKDSKD